MALAASGPCNWILPPVEFVPTFTTPVKPELVPFNGTDELPEPVVTLTAPAPLMPALGPA